MVPVVRRPRSSRRVFAAAAFGLLTAFCSGSSSPTGPTPAAPPVQAPSEVSTYTVAGTVKDTSGHVIAGAVVSVADGEPNPNAGKEAATDAEGHYSLNGLTFTGFSLTVKAAGYADGGGAISLKTDTASTTEDFTLAPLIGAYAIAGTVSGPGGMRLASASVAIVDGTPAQNVGRSTNTDGNGVFRLAGLAFGSVVVRATASGYQSASRSVSMTFGSEVSTIELLLEPAASASAVTGVVRNQSGATLANASVTIVDSSAGSNVGRQAMTDGSGTYRIGDLAAGSITVSVSANGYQTITQTVQLAGTSTSSDIVLPGVATVTYEIKGVVTSSGGSAIANATVSITDAAPNPNAGRTVRTDSHGAYSLSGLAYGAVSLSISATGYQTATRSVQLVSGTLTATADVSLTPTVTTYTITGTVSREGGGPIPGAGVYLQSTPTGPRGTTTDANGRYILTDVQYSATVPMLALASGFFPQQRTIPLTFGTETTVADFTLKPYYVITFAGAGAAGSAVGSYTEQGFTVTPTAAPWVAHPGGAPAPSIVFQAAAGTTVEGAIAVRAGGALFKLYSLQMYSGGTQIPYKITGTRGGATVFEYSGQQTNTGGSFVGFSNSGREAQIDTLTIRLTNQNQTTCCTIPMGVDEIWLFY